MNTAEPWRPACDHEDQVIASFLDGEPGHDVEAAAAHLADCPSCAQALRQARALEALLASQTRTDIDEGLADRLLAGVDPARSNPEGTRPRKRIRGWWPAAAAALLALVVAGAVVWSRTPGYEPGAGRDVDDHTPGITRITARFDEVPEAIPSRASAESAERFVLPEGVRVEVCAGDHPALDDLSDRDWLAALRGETVPGLDRRTLSLEVHALLTDAATRSVDRPELIQAAVGWQLDQMRRGLAGPDRLRLVGQVVLASAGETRRCLVATLRRHEARCHRFARWRLHNRAADPAVVGLVGALGFRDLGSRVQTLPRADRVRCAMQARATGDRQCLALLVDLFVHEIGDPQVVLDDYMDWFIGLSPGALDVLVWMLKRAAGRGTDALVTYRCEELMMRLGMTGTSSFWFAAPDGERLRHALP